MFAIPLTLIPLSPCSAERLENLRGTRRSWEIALHAFSETSLEKRGFATGRQPAGFIRCDQHVGLSFAIALQRPQDDAGRNFFS
jgi:hypothetical protein